MIRSNNFTSIGVFILIFFTNSCNELWGDHKLGNNFSLLEGDKIQDRVIVYCAPAEAETCTGGTFVVPTYKRHMISGNYAEYVDIAKSNKKYIIVKTVSNMNDEKYFYIIDKEFSLKNLNCDSINCDSIIQAHVIGPMDSVSFQSKRTAINLNLSF